MDIGGLSVRDVNWRELDVGHLSRIQTLRLRRGHDFRSAQFENLAKFQSLTYLSHGIISPV
jgi:hypothetical protein